MPNFFGGGVADPPDSPDELRAKIEHLERRANPGPDAMLKNFKYDHLKGIAQETSKPFYDMAVWLSEMFVMDERERQVALRKLLEAKDCAVRSVITRD